jgi:hypothetical protein
MTSQGNFAFRDINSVLVDQDIRILSFLKHILSGRSPSSLKSGELVMYLLGV